MDATATDSTWPSRLEFDRHFAEGLEAGRNGQEATACPHAAPGAADGGSMVSMCWHEGWGFGRFLLIRQLRRSMPADISAAIEALVAYQARYSALSIRAAKGFLRGGPAAPIADWRLGRLAREIRDRREYTFLAQVGVEMTLPWGRAHYPYHFQFWDRQLAPLGGHYRNLLRLVDVYGKRHGVRAAFLEYSSDVPPPGVLRPLD